MSQQTPLKRRRAYRHRVICSICQKEILSEYQVTHAKTKHKGKKVKFTIPVDATQSKLCFTTNNKTAANSSKVRKSHVVSENADETSPQPQASPQDITTNVVSDMESITEDVISADRDSSVAGKSDVIHDSQFTLESPQF